MARSLAYTFPRSSLLCLLNLMFWVHQVPHHMVSHSDPFHWPPSSHRERAFGLSLRTSPTTCWCKRLPRVRQALLHVLLPWTSSGAPLRFTLSHFLSAPALQGTISTYLSKGPLAFQPFLVSTSDSHWQEIKEKDTLSGTVPVPSPEDHTWAS